MRTRRTSAIWSYFRMSYPTVCCVRIKWLLINNKYRVRQLFRLPQLSGKVSNKSEKNWWWNSTAASERRSFPVQCQIWNYIINITFIFKPITTTVYVCSRTEWLNCAVPRCASRPAYSSGHHRRQDAAFPDIAAGALLYRHKGARRPSDRWPCAVIESDRNCATRRTRSNCLRTAVWSMHRIRPTKCPHT